MNSILLTLYLLVWSLLLNKLVDFSDLAFTTSPLLIYLYRVGFLQSADGAVLKPALGLTKGDREVRFYQKLFSEDCQDRVLLDLRHFVPKFLGLWTTPEHPGSKCFLHRLISRAVSNPNFIFWFL